MNVSEFTNELEYLIRARYTAIQINTFEEERAIEIVNKIGQKLGKRIIKWSATNGFILDSKSLDSKSLDFKTAVSMAEELGKEPTLFIWCDIHQYLKNQTVYVRCFRELCQRLRTGFPSNSVIISPIIEIPTELQKEVNILDLPMPDRIETKTIINSFAGNYIRRDGVKIDLCSDSLDMICQASVGLTKSEIENSLAKSLVMNKSISKNDVELLLQEKKQIIRKTGILEYISTKSFSLDQIGGLQNLKRWLEKRKMAFTAQAKEFGVEWPKGVLLVGVPGCGKSLSAKCIAAAWKMPLLKLDMGRIYSGIVGSSEANMRLALSLCETVSPAILWIDEIEKGLSGVSRGDSDGGTAARVFGNLLTWMQEKKSPVFVFATANQINSIPPELLRKGRFDEIFFVDLPSSDERKEIFSIMLKGCGRDPDSFDIKKLAELSGEKTLGDGIRLTGSEIESSVKDGLLEAYYDRAANDEMNRNLITEDIITAINRIVPLSKSRKEDIKAIREWAGENAVRASTLTSDNAGTILEKPVGRNIDF